MSTRFSHKALLSLLLATVICSGCAPTEITSDFSETSTTQTPPEASAPEGSTSSTEQTSSVPEPIPPKIAPDYESLSKALDKAMTDRNATGMSVAVFKDSEILYTYGNGLADKENKIPFTDNTRTRVASVSKMVTSMIMMTLYDQGKITPDSVLSEVTGLPFDAPGKGKVKLWHLMTHTAGFVDTEKFNSFTSDIKYLLKTSHTNNEPGTAYLYTNFGAGTAGAVIECLSGEYFYEYADKALFKPLGMDAGYNIEMISDKESVAKLYENDTITDVQHCKRGRSLYRIGGLGNSCYCAQC